MRQAWIIFRRETAAAFDSPIAYIFAAAFLVLTGSVFMNDFFLASVAEMDGYFRWLPYVLAVFIPTLSMRLWAEDRKHNTFELLMTLPLQPLHIVLGKYLSSLFVFALVLAGSLPIVAMLYALGEPDGGKILAAYVGAGFLGAFYLAVGLFISGLARDQIVAYLLTLLALCAFTLSGHEAFASVVDGLWPERQIGSLIRNVFSALPRYESFTRGVVDMRDAAYFIVLSSYFLFLNRLFLEKDRK